MNFISLYRDLDSTNSTLDKIAALGRFFQGASSREIALAIRLIQGVLPPRKLKTADLRARGFARTRIPSWLFDEAYSSVGDLAETIALVVEPEDPVPFEDSVSAWIEANLATRESSLAALEDAMGRWDAFSLMVLMKLMTGGLRVGVARGLLIKALAKTYSIEEGKVAHALMGGGSVDEAFVDRLVAGTWEEGLSLSSPFPFALASPIEDSRDALGPVEDWLFEWKWDGIRGQWIYRDRSVAIWSRGEELITDRFPELSIAHEFAGALPLRSLVLDGEIMAWREGEPDPLPFQDLQTRIGRKKLTASVLRAAPARFVAYDCLEKDGVDLRDLPIEERRKILESSVRALASLTPAFGISEVVTPSSWAEAEDLHSGSREKGVEGFILKRKGSRYFHGRRRGDWWKWKIDPMTMDAVLVYAQSGHGKRSNLFTDYTFALRDSRGELVPVAKAYSGLDNSEILELDRWIRKHTRERFGPVRSVDPVQAFEIAFEGIGESTRHKSGIAVRFPRILRWRTDKPVSEIDRLDEVRERYISAPRRPPPPSDNLSLFPEGPSP
jgi:DNA ligase-1